MSDPENGVYSVVDEEHVGTFADAVGALSHECRLHFETTGFRVEVVDPAGVASTRAMLTEPAFEHYELGDRCVIGLHLERFEEVLGFADTGEPVGIGTRVDGVAPVGDEDEDEDGEDADVDEQLRGFLEVETGEITHDVALIDVESIREEPSFPDLDLSSRVVLEGSQLDRAVKACDTVSDHLEIAGDADADTVTFAAKGDTDSVDVELGTDDALELTADDGSSLFSVDYLKDLVKPIPRDAEVEIRFGETFPMIMQWGYAEQHGTVKNMLAPRVDKD